MQTMRPMASIRRRIAFANKDVMSLTEAGVEPVNIVQRSQFPGVILEWLVDGRGVGVLFDATARMFVEGGRLLRLSTPLRPVKAIFLASAPTGPAVRCVSDFLRALLAATGHRPS